MVNGTWVSCKERSRLLPHQKYSNLRSEGLKFSETNTGPENCLREEVNLLRESRKVKGLENRANPFVQGTMEGDIRVAGTRRSRINPVAAGRNPGPGHVTPLFPGNKRPAHRFLTLRSLLPHPAELQSTYQCTEHRQVGLWLEDFQDRSPGDSAPYFFPSC